MTKHEYFQFAEKFFGDCLETSKRKNADYTGGSEDPFSNFKSVEVLGISAETGFLTRMMDKMKRISSFVEKGELQVKDEAVTDTLADLCNYCVLMAGLIESRKTEKPVLGDSTPIHVDFIVAENPESPLCYIGTNDPIPLAVQFKGERILVGKGEVLTILPDGRFHINNISFL